MPRARLDELRGNPQPIAGATQAAAEDVGGIELLTDLEEAFEVEIPDYELRGVTTFGALAMVIERRI